MSFSTERRAETKENQTVLQRIAAGDQTGVQKCFEQYGKLIWYLADKYLRTSGETEDAVQEIFIAVWQNAGRFDPAKGNETAFITLIARRRLIDRLRRRMCKPEFQILDEITVKCPTNYEKRIQVRLDAKRAGRVLNGLRPDQKKIINMAIYDGFTHLEIAEAMEMPLGTVKTLIRRGFQKMRKSLEQNACLQTATA